MKTILGGITGRHVVERHARSSAFSCCDRRWRWQGFGDSASLASHEYQRQDCDNQSARTSAARSGQRPSDDKIQDYKVRCEITLRRGGADPGCRAKTVLLLAQRATWHRIQRLIVHGSKHVSSLPGGGDYFVKRRDSV